MCIAVGGVIYREKYTLTSIGRLVGWLDRETIADGRTMTCEWMDVDTDIRITECKFVS